jgi:hypothetical protein
MTRIFTDRAENNVFTGLALALSTGLLQKQTIISDPRGSAQSASSVFYLGQEWSKITIKINTEKEYIFHPIERSLLYAAYQCLLPPCIVVFFRVRTG